MRQLLNSNTLRQLSFLEALFETDDWQPVNTFATQLGCSSRILRSDIAMINASYQPFQINVSPKSGVQLGYPQNYSLDFIYAAVLRNSSEFQLLELLFFNDGLSLVTLTEKLYLSASSIHRMVKKINEELSPLGFMINTTPYELIGDEAAIRFFFVHYFYERYLGHETPLKTDQQQTINHLIQRLARHLHLNLTFPDLKLIRLTLTAGLIRIKNGHCQEHNAALKKSPLFALFLSDPSLKTTLETCFQLPLTDIAIMDLFYFFLRKDFAINADYLYHVLLPEHAETRHLVLTIEGFLTTLSKRLGIPLENKAQLTLEIYNVQRVFLMDNFILFNKKRTFRKNAQSEYPLLVPLLNKELQHLAQVMNADWNEAALDEILYMILIHWPNLNQQLEQFYAAISIGIFCDYDDEHSAFLAQLITFHFGNSIKITILSAQTEEEALTEKHDYDIFITNLSCFDLSDPQVICINAVPTMHDWQNIQQSIKEIATSRDFITTRFIH